MTHGSVVSAQARHPEPESPMPWDMMPRVGAIHPKARFGNGFWKPSDSAPPVWVFPTELCKEFCGGQTEVHGREPTRVGYVARTCLRGCLLALTRSGLSRRGASTYPCALRQRGLTRKLAVPLRVRAFGQLTGSRPACLRCLAVPPAASSGLRRLLSRG